MSKTIGNGASSTDSELREQKVLGNAEGRLSAILSGPDGKEDRPAPVLDGMQCGDFTLTSDDEKTYTAEQLGVMMALDPGVVDWLRDRAFDPDERVLVLDFLPYLGQLQNGDFDANKNEITQSLVQNGARMIGSNSFFFATWEDLQNARDAMLASCTWVFYTTANAAQIWHAEPQPTITSHVIEAETRTNYRVGDDQFFKLDPLSEMLNRFKLGVKVCLQSQNCYRAITTRPPWVPPGNKFTPSPASGSNAIPLGNQPSSVTQRSKPKVQDPALDEQLTERQRRLKNISQALRIYIDQKREQDKMVAEERAQFELGKRYLANMMGWDPKAEMQQEDIDKAIRYLFPASLTDSKAEPIMKPPEEWLPNFRAIEVDEEGRPKDTYFYTLRPKLYRLLTDIAAETQHAIELCKGKTLKSETEKEERFNKQQIPKWVTAEEISNIIGEKINEPMYVNVKAALDYRDSIPTPPGETSIMEKFRAAGGGLRLKKIFGHFRPVILYGKTKTGERYKYTEVKVRVKRCYMLVKVKYPGTGKIIVNGISYDEYRSLLSREVLLAPMLITDLFGKIDIVSKVIPGVNGEVSVGGHIIFPRTTRYGTSIGIAALFPEKKDILRLSGLLTYDVRNTERKKIAQKGARAKWIWLRR